MSASLAAVVIFVKAYTLARVQNSNLSWNFAELKNPTEVDTVNANLALPGMSFLIDQMQRPDWDEVREIYLQGIAGGQATFETEAPSWERWDSSHLAMARLVAREDGRLIGWAALSPVSLRRAYAGVAETSVYVTQDRRAAGVGRQLLAALISESERNQISTLQAVMFPENEASVALHRACGFREVGRRERIGKLDGQWRDSILFERRSRQVGVD